MSSFEDVKEAAKDFNESNSQYEFKCSDEIMYEYCDLSVWHGDDRVQQYRFSFDEACAFIYGFTACLDHQNKLKSL